MRSAGPIPAPAGPPDTSYLSSVLTRWGHPCDRGCVVEDPALRRFWFSRHATSGGAVLVAVCEDADRLFSHHLLRRLNVYTREHGICVLPRGQDDPGRALTSLVTVPA